jgi:phosphatidylethanolamine/phosphatidyl-N-methylethanolamine N-methyltransferase
MASRYRYDLLAPHYDSAMRPLDRWFLGRMRQKAIELLPKKAHLLEIGAGTGINFYLYHSDQTGVAAEPSGGMLRVARSKPRPEGLCLVQSCAEDLPFECDSFDTALATLVLCSVESPQKALSELRRVVKPGGSIVLLEHVRPGGLLGLMFDLFNFISVPLVDDHINRRTVDQVEAAGLQLVQVEKRLWGIMNLIVCRA